MALSNDVISQFAKLTKTDKPASKEATVYGVIVDYDGSKHVKLDGSDLLTPISSTTNVEADERVTVMIKDHTATVTGNLSSPAARTAEVSAVGDKISEFEIVIADKVDTLELVAVQGRVEILESDNVKINETLEANKADIEELRTDKLSAEEAELKYANINFTNIGEAAMEYFYSSSGLIKNVVVGDQTITGELVGVTISGDLIEGNTIKAEKLVVKGSDGLYYKLNVEAGATTSEQISESDLQNGLHGSAIIAKTITADRISVTDLVAFDATIGGFNITDSALYSGVKESVDNTTRGIYLDNTGQIAFGDSVNYLKYFKDTDGSYKLAISADSIYLSSGKNIGSVVEDLESRVIEGGFNVTHVQFTQPSGTFNVGDTWIKSIVKTTWSALNSETWADVKSSLWGELGYSDEPVSYVWNGSQWVLTVDYNVVKDNSTEIKQTAEAITSKADKSVVDTLSGTVSNHSTLIEQNAEAIEMKANKTDPAGSVSTSSVTIDADGIEMSGGEINVKAGSAINIESGGKLTMESDHFDLDASGNMSAQNAYLSGDVYVNGSPALSKRDIYVGTNAPSNPTSGMVWIRPDTSTSAQTTFSTPVPWTGRYSLRTTTRSGSLTGVATASVGTIFTYRIRVPVYIKSYSDGTTGAVVHFDVSTTQGGSVVLAATKNVTITDYGSGTKTIEMEVTGSSWIGNQSTLYYSLYVTDLSGYYAYNVLNSSDNSANITLECISTSSSGATGWRDCAVYCYA